MRDEIKRLFSFSVPIVIRILSLRLLTSKCLTSILSNFSFLYTYSAPGLSGIWTNKKLVWLGQDLSPNCSNLVDKDLRDLRIFSQVDIAYSLEFKAAQASF